jgi:hypothetical protein
MQLEDLVEYDSGQDRQTLYQLAPGIGRGLGANEAPSQTSQSSHCEAASHGSILE